MIIDVYNEIIAEKGNHPELDELNSESNVAVWRQWVWIVASILQTLTELFESFRQYIDDFFATRQAGTLKWWLAELRKFQHGDTLQFIDNIYKYASIDESKKIVKQVAIEVNNKVLVIKVANSDETGLIPFTTQQKDSLLAYVNLIKFPGTYANILSQDADDLKLEYRIYYDAMINKSTIETQINAAIEDYLQNLVFNGKFVITECTDRTQRVTGVQNPVFVSGFGKSSLQTDDEYVLITDFYNAVAGYMKLNLLTLTFIPNV